MILLFFWLYGDIS